MNVKSKQGERSYPFFVYGTLLPGQPNDYLWQEEGVSVAPATFCYGRLFDMGNYPMLVEGGEGAVSGYVVTVPDSQYEVVLARMDRLEGFDPDRPDVPGYRRVVRNVTLKDGRSLTVWVYLGQVALVNGRPIIAEGDWATYIAIYRERSRRQLTNIGIIYGLHDPFVEY